MRNKEFDYLLSANTGNYENSVLLEADSAESAKHYDEHKISELGSESRDFGIPVYRDEGKVLTAPYCHSLFVGATGSGKTIYIINQILLFLMLPEKKRPNLIITDCKGELQDFLLELLQIGGYTDTVLDCRDTYFGKSYNMLHIARHDYRMAMMCKYVISRIDAIGSDADVARLLKDAEEMFSSEHDTDLHIDFPEFKNLYDARNHLVMLQNGYFERADKRINSILETIITVEDPKDKIWVIGGRVIVKGLIFTFFDLNAKSRELISDEEVTISSVAKLLTRRDSDGEFDNTVDFLNSAGTEYGKDANSYFKMRAQVTRDGYYSTATSHMGWWTGDGITALVSEADHIDLAQLANTACNPDAKPFVVFLKPDEEDPATGVLLNCFVSDAVSELRRAADKSPARRLERPTLFVLDEFANIGNKIEGMTTYITTMRSRNVFFELYIQSYEQFDEVYGEKAARILRQNCDLQVFLGTNSYQTRQEIANSFGQTQAIITSENVSRGGTGINHMPQNVPLVHVSDLECMKLGEIYVQYSRKPHLHSFVKPYFLLENNPVAAHYLKKTDAEPKKYNPARSLCFDLTAYINDAEERFDSFPGNVMRVIANHYDPFIEKVKLDDKEDEGADPDATDDGFGSFVEQKPPAPCTFADFVERLKKMRESKETPADDQDEETASESSDDSGFFDILDSTDDTDSADNTDSTDGTDSSGSEDNDGNTGSGDSSTDSDSGSGSDSGSDL